VLERWTRTVLRFRVAVLGLWLAVLVVGVWSTTRLSPLLSNSFAVPGTDSDRARTILTRNFGERTDGTFTVVFRVPKASDPARASPGEAAPCRGRARRAHGPPGRRSSWSRSAVGRPRHESRPTARQAIHRGDSGEPAGATWSPGFRHRPAGDPARPRLDLRLRPAPGRVIRPPDRAPRPARRLRALARGRGPVRLRRLHDHGDAGGRLRSRARPLDGHLCDESRRVDRSRSCDRLLAPRRSQVPR
jgi:hypothetical protein